MMARPYTSADVNLLIKNHKELLNTLTEVQREILKIQPEAEKKISSLNINNYFGKLAKEEFAGDKLLPKNKEFEALKKNLFLLLSYRKINANNQDILKEYRDRINGAVSKASVMGSAIRWTFSSSKTKAESDEAVRYLFELYEGSYKKRVSENHDLFIGISKTGTDEIYDDFNRSPAKYEQLCREFIEKKKYSIHEIKEISSLNVRLSDLKDKENQIQKNLQISKNEIKSSALAVKQREANKILKDVPIEALNRDTSGVRIKLLLDNGYKSIYDVLSVSKDKLVSINGIGNDNAQTIYTQARKYASEAVKNVNIRLSSDDKSIENKKLLSSIYEYIKQKDVFQRFKEYSLNDKTVMTEGIKVLSGIKDSLSWAFQSSERKTQIIDSYQSLKFLTDGDYYQNIDSFYKESQGIKTYSYDEVADHFEKNPVIYANILEEETPGILSNDDGMYGLPSDIAGDIQLQSFALQGLKCTLRPYQEWGVKYILHQERVLLGDEMGLGKTIQALASIVALKNTGETRFMVICPASVLANWCKEIQNKSDLTAVRIHGRDREEAFAAWKKDGGVAVTTYETTSHIVFETGESFSFLVVDEAHYVKNEEARRTKNVKEISTHAKRVLFMTGTALENKVDEMISLIEILKPDIAKEVKNIAFMASAQQFRDKVASVYYRRKREDVLTELPEKIENEEWVILLDEEKKSYEADVLAKRYSDIRRVSWKNEDISKSSKAIRLKEIVDEAADDGRKIIVFSFFLDTIDKVRRVLGDRCSEPINGSVPPQKRQEIIEEFDKAEPGSVLVAQIQSGGTGLNIQSASVVIICEPQLKPSIENQAISRSYRMGQARNVLVYRLLCDDTVDEKIMDLLKQKQDIFNAFADDSTAADNTKEIDEKSFSDIIDEEIRRITENNTSDSTLPDVSDFLDENGIGEKNETSG